MVKEAQINCWSAVVSLAEMDRSVSRNAKAVLEMASKVYGFGNEMSWRIDEQGTWTIRIFSCYDDQNEVVLKVMKNGHVFVELILDRNSCLERRSFSFG